MSLSPLTRKEVVVHNPLGSDNGVPATFRFEHEKDGFDDFRCSTSLLTRLGYNRPIYAYEEWKTEGLRIVDQRIHPPAETYAALDLVRGYLWRSFQRDSKKLIVTCLNEHEAFVDQLEKSDKLKYVVAKPFEEFIREAASLTMASKAIQTLENLHTLWNKQGLDKPLAIPYSALDSEQNPYFRSAGEADPIENGVCFGSSKSAAPLVYQFLLDEGLISFMKSGGAFRGFRISSKGFAELDRLAKGKILVRQGFLVRRYDEAQDRFLRPVMDEVERRLSCPIKAVWEQDHNDRIDERIFRLIRESAVVVVDVSSEVGASPDRINVGLELGYALALNKPVVVIRQKPSEDAKDWQKVLPFDIITANCYDYKTTEDGTEALISKLEARIGLALDVNE